MILISVQIDPRIVAALDSIATAASQPRSHTIRDALYSYVWDVKRNEAANSHRAPAYPKAFDEQGIRVLDGKLLTVDEWGLLV
jgi:metal-responsive CopG/Arc/MetJ family transcriptional regulator